MLPDQLPTGADPSLAFQRLQSVQRFLDWVRPLAAQLDRAHGTQSYQGKLNTLKQEADQLAVLLMKGTT